MDCPRCNEKMLVADSSGIATHRCHYCSGTWIGHDAMDQLLSREQTSLDIETLKTSVQYRAGSGKQRACPECSQQDLLRVFVYSVELDICPACHGLYFDEGELQAILPTLHKPDGKLGIGTEIVGEGLFWIIISLLSNG